MIQFKQKEYSEEDRHVFLSYLSSLTGFLNKCKNLHWAAPKKDIHVYLDEYHKLMSDFQDAVAEGYMGILGKMGPSDVQCVECGDTDFMKFIDHVIEETTKFYQRIPQGPEFKGLCGETETFMQDSQKYRYLFGLCSDKKEEL